MMKTVVKRMNIIGIVRRILETMYVFRVIVSQVRLCFDDIQKKEDEGILMYPKDFQILSLSVY